MIYLHEAIYALNPLVAYIRQSTAYDIDDNEVTYNKDDVEVKAAELQAQAEIDAQAVVDAKQSALNKLMALGLTEEEALALGVK